MSHVIKIATRFTVKYTNCNKYGCQYTRVRPPLKTDQGRGGSPVHHRTLSPFTITSSAHFSQVILDRSICEEEGRNMADMVFTRMDDPAGLFL